MPIGVFQWTLDRRLGTIIPTENNDTMVHHYSHFNNTDGYNGEYNYLGNIASPRLSRVYLNRTELMPFLILQPLDYGIQPLEKSLFSNTLSPITNLSYHSCGNNQTGEDRVRAYFATNINKRAGVGFKIDYLYGRGYYNSSQNSVFNTNLFGYYQGERYQMHLWTDFAHQKNAESGGVEDDRYIRNPQSFPQSYASKDIPSMLAEAFNRNDVQTYYLTHRYNLGYYRELVVPDSIKPKMPSDDELLMQLNDSLRQIALADSAFRRNMVDSLQMKWENSLVNPREFVSVSSLIHTFQVDHIIHHHYSQNTPEHYYTNLFYGTPADLSNETRGVKLRNTIGLTLNEGFKRWVKFGLTFFATHQHENYDLPIADNTNPSAFKRYAENDISVGGEMSKRNGSLLHYKVNGEVTLIGKVGAFNVEGWGDLNVAIGKRDTAQLAVHAFIKNQKPDFYLRHFHSQTTWWDNDLDMEKRLRIEGTLSNRRTKTSLTVGFENLARYTYLSMQNKLLEGADPASNQSTAYSHNVRVGQVSHNIQVFSAALKQDFRLGPLNWENEITFQTSSSNLLPLPKLNVYSNLFLLFRMGIKKVLRVEVGGDIRYFTSYDAPDYAPSIGQFALQDPALPMVKIGNYPIVNVYANLHLKHCRIYAAVNHVNAGTGNMFLAPHYPINPLSIHWGVSWNFFN
ncbi:MAG: putative porin [Bacteroidales bacterium]|nr:putative porin [Candidatus Physcousia equi]